MMMTRGKKYECMGCPKRNLSADQVVFIGRPRVTAQPSMHDLTEENVGTYWEPDHGRPYCFQCYDKLEEKKEKKLS